MVFVASRVLSQSTVEIRQLRLSPDVLEIMMKFVSSATAIHTSASDELIPSILIAFN